MMKTSAACATGRGDGDSGMTLIELLVAMGIFTTVIAVFMSAVVSMTRTTARAQGVSDSTTMVRTVLDRFDKQVRYSSAVNSPGFGASGSYYVEYLAPSQVDGANPACAQWRFDPTGRTIALRTWTDSTTPSPSDWSTIATNVRNVATNPPFVFVFAGPASLHQQLTVTLDIGPGSLSGAQSSATYVARNTSTSTSSNTDVNSDHVSDNPVCQLEIPRP